MLKYQLPLCWDPTSVSLAAQELMLFMSRVNLFSHAFYLERESQSIS